MTTYMHVLRRIKVHLAHHSRVWNIWWRSPCCWELCSILSQYRTWEDKRSQSDFYNIPTPKKTHWLFTLLVCERMNPLKGRSLLKVPLGTHPSVFTLRIKFLWSYSEDSQATPRCHQVNKVACPKHSATRLKAKTSISHEVLFIQNNVISGMCEFEPFWHHHAFPSCYWERNGMEHPENGTSQTSCFQLLFCHLKSEGDTESLP